MAPAAQLRMIRGWCPSLYRPMPSGDGLLVRIRPPGGQMSPPQLRALARASEEFGSGLVELTGQGRLQIRGLSHATVADFATEMVRVGLASSDPDIEHRRRVTLLPGGDASLAMRIEAALIGSAIPLADKFDVLVGVDNEAPTDIMLHEGLIWLEGATHAATLIDPEQAVIDIVRHLAGSRARSADADDLYRAAALTPDQVVPIGKPAVIGAGALGFGIGIMFGCMRPTTLRGLATLAEQHCHGNWQLTRSRALFLATDYLSPALQITAEVMGLITDPKDRRRRVSACIGAPHCASASVDARADALARLPDLPDGKRLHVSACRKKCGMPTSADLVIIAHPGNYETENSKHFFFEKKKQKTFDLGSFPL